MRHFVNGCVHYAKKMKKNHYQLKSCLFFCIVLFFCESSQCEMKICGDNHGIFKTIKQLKMKTILNLKQYVILLVAAFAMTSCLDSDDPAFQVAGTGYVIQTISEQTASGEEEATITSRFTPIILAGANEPMTKCSVKAPGGESILMTQLDGYSGITWVSNTSYGSEMDKLPSGTFTITAYNQEEEPAQGVAVINNTTEMKAKLKGDVEFKDSKITATFNKVEGATDYLVMIKKSRSSIFYTSITVANYSATELEKADWTVTIDESTYSSKVSSLEAGSYFLTIAAAVSSSSGLVLYQESEEYDNFTKN